MPDVATSYLKNGIEVGSAAVDGVMAGALRALPYGGAARMILELYEPAARWSAP